MGQLSDGSRKSWVTKYDPLSLSALQHLLRLRKQINIREQIGGLDSRTLRPVNVLDLLVLNKERY